MGGTAQVRDVQDQSVILPFFPVQLDFGAKYTRLRMDLEEFSDDGSVVGQGVDNLAVGCVGIVGVVGLDLEHFGAGLGVLGNGGHFIGFGFDEAGHAIVAGHVAHGDVDLELKN